MKHTTKGNTYQCTLQILHAYCSNNINKNNEYPAVNSGTEQKQQDSSKSP